MLIIIKVFPGSKKPAIIKKSENKFEVRVKAKPVELKANKETVEILAEYFNIPENKIRVLAGLKRRNKIIEIIKDTG